MSVSVYVSVCQRGYLRNHTCDLYQIFVHVDYGRGSVLRQGNEIPREGAILGVFFTIDSALYIIGREVGVGLHTAGEV